MKVLKILSAKPALFFRLAGIRLTDFNALVATLHPIWLKSEARRLSRKGRKRAIGGGMSYHLEFAEQLLPDIPHIPSKFMEFVPLSHRQGNCIPYAAIRWHDFGNRPALGRPLGHFSRHPDTPLLSLSPRRRFPRPTPERVFVADHQSSSGFSGTGPSAPPPQPIGT